MEVPPHGARVGQYSWSHIIRCWVSAIDVLGSWQYKTGQRRYLDTSWIDGQARPTAADSRLPSDVVKQTDDRDTPPWWPMACPVLVKNKATWATVDFVATLEFGPYGGPLFNLLVNHNDPRFSLSTYYVIIFQLRQSRWGEGEVGLDVNGNLPSGDRKGPSGATGAASKRKPRAPSTCFATDTVTDPAVCVACCWQPSRCSLY